MIAPAIVAGLLLAVTDPSPCPRKLISPREGSARVLATLSAPSKAPGEPSAPDVCLSAEWEPCFSTQEPATAATGAAIGPVPIPTAKYGDTGLEPARHLTLA